MSAYIPPHRRRAAAAQRQDNKDTKSTAQGTAAGQSAAQGAQGQNTATKSNNNNAYSDFFDECYCINLARRSDRLRKYEASARRTGLRWTRFEAIDGAAVGNGDDFDPLWDATRNAEWDRHVAPGLRRATAGERGCALSHVALWRKAVETEGWLLITEDDCRFDKRWTPGSPAYLWRTHVPSDAELVYLGFSDRGEREYVAGSEEVFRPTYGFCTHCYAIRSGAARKFLDALPVAGPVDVWLADNNWFGAQVYCVIQPGGGWQNTGRWLANQETKPGDADVRQSSRDAIVAKTDAADALAGATRALRVDGGRGGRGRGKGGGKDRVGRGGRGKGDRNQRIQVVNDRAGLIAAAQLRRDEKRDVKVHAAGCSCGPARRAREAAGAGLLAEVGRGIWVRAGEAEGDDRVAAERRMAAALLPHDSTDGVRLKVKCSICLLKHEPNGCVALVGAADDLDPFVARSYANRARADRAHEDAADAVATVPFSILRRAFTATEPSELDRALDQLASCLARVGLSAARDAPPRAQHHLTSFLQKERAVVKDDELLFLICYDDDSHWTLDLPGGKRHLAETAWAAARREITEEALVEIAATATPRATVALGDKDMRCFVVDAAAASV
jgi:GR25 family glycosyltransferase involved in LPS biosynthesis